MGYAMKQVFSILTNVITGFLTKIICGMDYVN